MPQIAFGLGDLFDPSALPISAHSLENPNLPVENAHTLRPREVFGSAFGFGAEPGMPTGGGSFDVGPTNRFLDVDVGGGEISIGLSLGTYSNVELAAEIQTSLVLAADPNFIVFVNADAKFQIFNNVVSWTLLTKTGTHGTDNADDGIYNEIGVTDGIDYVTAAGAQFIAQQQRHSTHTWIIYDAGKQETPLMTAAILRSNSTFLSTSRSDVKIFARDLPFTLFTRDGFEAQAEFDTDMSDPGADEDNPLQLAVYTPPEAYRYWVFSWRHVVPGSRFEVGYLRWPTVIKPTSTSLHVRNLRGHTKRDLSEPAGVSRFWGIQRGKFWRMPLAFEQWPEDEWRTVGHALRNHPKTQPIIVALNYDDLVAGDVTAEDETEKGYLFLASLIDTGSDNYVGANSKFIDSEILLEQLR